MKGEKFMRKLLAGILLVVMCLSFSTSAFAAEGSISTDKDGDFISAWVTVRDKGYLQVNDDGLLELVENDFVKNLAGYDSVVEMIALCNESIQDDILLIDPETMELTSVITPEEEPQPYGLVNPVPPILPRNGAHGCSVQALDLLHLCSSNYSILSNYYQDMLLMLSINPNLSPWGATVGFWVSKVEPNGDWDYKTKHGFAPWNSQFCSYFDGNFQHITSEYIGNFNYGYTGSFLFSLNTLHLGSWAVSGFDPADEADWPAIDAGYNNAPK